MTSSDMRNEAKRDPREDLPSFLREPDKIDKVPYASLILAAVYGFTIVPFHAVLLLKHTLLHMQPTDSNLSVLILAPKDEDRSLLLFAVVVIAALSTVKFMPFFYWMGKKWGLELITMSFGGHPPRWFKEMENFIYEHIGLSVLASFVPFSSIPATVMVVIGDIAKARSWIMGVYLFLYATVLKCFYLYLGPTFGPNVQGSLQTIDKYAVYITLALIGRMLLSIWWKNKKSSGQMAQSSSCSIRDSGLYLSHNAFSGRS